MRRISIAAFLVTALITTACARNTAPDDAASRSPQGTEQRAASIDDTLRIPLGAARSTDGGAVTVRFDKRIADSRCPANAVCVWMGDAHVQIRATAAGRDTTAELHTALEPKLLRIGEHALSLVTLLPYPGTGDDAAAPSVWVRVTR